MNLISILIMSLDNSRTWEQKRRDIRKRFLADGRRLSYKALNDKNKLKALKPFLESANEIDGLCANIAIRKKSGARYINKDYLPRFNKLSPFTAKWNIAELNRMFRIVHLVSIFIAGLCKPKQNIYWISDQDQLFANEARSNDVASLLSAFTSIYVKHELGELGIGTTALDEGDRAEEDNAAIPDLCAGALSDFLTKLCDICGDKIAGGLSLPCPQGTSMKSDIINSWIADNRNKLKKLILLFEKQGNDLFGITRLEFE